MSELSKEEWMKHLLILSSTSAKAVDLIEAANTLHVHMDSQAKRIEELEAENGELRKGAQLGPIIGAETILKQHKQLADLRERLRKYTIDYNCGREYRHVCRECRQEWDGGDENHLPDCPCWLTENKEDKT